MILDRFITKFMRLKTKDYLAFGELGQCEPPEAPAQDIQLYMHIPFCRVLCPYCSFHRVAFREDLARPYFHALRKELDIYHQRGFKFSEIYIGGGTPTILMDELVKTLKHLNNLFKPKDISIETNPDSLNRETLSVLSDLGAGRVSVGVQTFNDKLLKLIGRYEKYGSGDELIEKITKAKNIVRTLNIDMIYNFPAQNRNELINDIYILNKIKPDQVTFYPLMVSDETTREMKKIMGAHSFRKERLFNELISKNLSPDYYPQSAWCFSLSDAMIDEYVTSNEDYAGAGSGAFGLAGGYIYANTFSIGRYINDLREGRLPVYAKKKFSRKELARYMFLMGLFGLKVSRSMFVQRFGKDPWNLLPLECMFFTLIGALKTTSGSLHLTEKGRYYWVIMMREFFTGVDNFRDMSRLEAGSKYE
jgi:menaquinone C8-methyltransferase